MEDVLYAPGNHRVQSRSSRRPAVIGGTPTGKTVMVIYERYGEAGHVVIRPVTAYEIQS